jgi:hypothetical protein
MAGADLNSSPPAAETRDIGVDLIGVRSTHGVYLPINY